MQIKPAAGFTLFEVLIAMLVLAVSMMGLVRLQAATNYAAHQAITRDLAQQLAAELAEWIRAGLPAASLLAIMAGPNAPPDVSCYRQTCTPQELALFDWHEWQQRVQRIAPAARISVCRSDSQTLLDWQCAADTDLQAPLLIRIGWPTSAMQANFPPSLALTVGPVPP
jgi:type IV pilus assembly protein PilV